MVLGHVENFICPSVLTADAQRLPADAKPRPGYLIGCMLVRRASFMRVGKLNADLRTGYFIDWWSRAMDAGLQYLMLSETTLRRRLRPNTLSFRSDRETDQIGKDALTIARAAIPPTPATSSAVNEPSAAANPLTISWPAASLRPLLKAYTLPTDAAIAAWHEWSSTADLDHSGWAESAPSGGRRGTP